MYLRVTPYNTGDPGSMKKILILPFLFLTTLLTAQTPEPGVPEPTAPEEPGILDTYFPVEGLYQWEYLLDISDLEEGTYNIVVKGEDGAGNIKTAEPVDIEVDGASDLPRVSMAYPSEGETIRGDINILGSAEDDDAVDYVELKLNDNPYSRADGSDYWSYPLTISNLKDGLYTLTARGVDINGKPGNERSVSFFIDRSVPLIRYESHKNGDFAGGKITLTGTAEDFNGIRDIRYSLDNGQSYRDTKFKGKDPEVPYNFSFDLDTRDLQDGPLTVTLQAEDERGSTGTSNLLLYVDNSSPELEILYPREETLINGRFGIIGRVSDDVGMKSLQYTVKGGEAVEIPLEPGNPFWSIDVDVSGEKQAVLEFVLTDIAENEKTFDFKHPIDKESDVPVLTLHSPSENQSSNQLLLSGWVQDNEKAGGILYEIDKRGEKKVESGQVFNLGFSDLPPGEHTVSIRSFDAAGIESEPVSVPFTLTGGSPLIEFTEYHLADKTTAEYLPGREVNLEELPGISGKITFESGAGTASYRLPDNTSGEIRLKKNETPGEYTFQLTFKDISGSGFYPITLQAKDNFGGETGAIAAFWLQGGKDGIFPLATEIPGKKGSYLFDRKMDFLFHGGKLTNAELENGENFSVSFKGDVITLEAVRPSSGTDLTIKGEDGNGKTWEYGPIHCITDTEAPALEIREPGDGTLLNDTLSVSGTILDNLEVESLEYRLQSGDFLPFPQGEQEETDLAAFSGSIALADLPDGRVSLKIRVTDKAGNTAEQEKLYIKDTTAPQIRQILPEPDETVNGLTSLLLLAEDDWTESYQGTLSIGEDKLPLKVSRNRLFVPLDLAPYEEIPEVFSVSVKDTKGNEEIYYPELTFDPGTDKPQVQIQVPLEDSLITEDTVFSGIVLDDDGVQNIEYRIDDGEFTRTGEGNSFEIPIRLNTLTDNDHSLEVRAFDLGGVESETVSVGFKVSLQSPQAEMTAPEIGITSKGIIQLSGTSRDANGVEAVYLSVDNGNTFQKVSGTEEWIYTLDTSVLVDGTYMILLKAVDSYGTEGISSALITVDNTAPVIELSSPRDGGSVKDELFLQMRVNDGLALKRISYSLTPLETTEGEGTDSIPETDLEVKNVVLHKIDTSTLAPGRYNLSLFAADEADNEVIVSRNFLKLDASVDPHPEILFPFDGASQQGLFSIEGQIVGAASAAKVTLLLNDQPFDVLDATEDGYFSRQILPEEMTEKDYTVQAEITLEDGEVVRGEVSAFAYSSAGPWIQIESVKTGDYVRNRPWISGTLSYPIPPSADGSEPSKQEIKNHEVTGLEYSLDNGKQFTRCKARGQWKFRLETQELSDGPLGILVRAAFNDGRTAVTKVFVEVDETAPDLAVLTPEENSPFNDVISVSGTAFDANGLKDISVMLREGTKASHELPQFIQGLYIDTHILGGTTWELGVGLTFFDDNVRLQGLIGQAPAGRFNGTVFGLKLLANVATFPYGYYFGPDWDFLSSSIAIGSAFEFFTMSESTSGQSGLVLGAMVAQLELIKVELDQLQYFNTYSLYLENQFWFISSDIEGGLEYRMAFGVRVNVF